MSQKSNEITSIPELVQALDLEGCVVTNDAMGTQSDVAEKISDVEADYVLALKDSQPALAEDMRLYFEDLEQQQHQQQEAGEKIDYHRSVDTDHGRVEIRECWSSEDLEWLHAKERWKGLRRVSMSRTKRIIGESEEVHYFISSLPENPEAVAEAVRAHWGIENSLHWVLDVAFREDEGRKRKDRSAKNFAVLRHITLNLLKQEKSCKGSIAGKRLLAGWKRPVWKKCCSEANCVCLGPSVNSHPGDSQFNSDSAGREPTATAVIKFFHHYLG